MSIIICGGHLTPAVALIQTLQKDYPQFEIIFVGRDYVFEKDKTASEERNTIVSMGLRFLPVTTGRSSGVSFVKLFIGMFQAFRYLNREKPTCIVSFGGYVALPIVLAGAVLGIPNITHEQTRNPGLANRIIATFAKKIALSFEDTQTKYFSSSKIIYTGLPIREEIYHPPDTIAGSVKRPYLLIVGGATGSESINNIIYKSLPRLLKKYAIIHQVGKKSYQNAIKHIQGGYTPFEYMNASVYSYFLHNAYVVIGRSGANTVTEIAAVGQIAIFVPLPWSSENEQFENAKFLEKSGSAFIIMQKDFTPESLLKVLSTLEQEKSMMHENALKLKKIIDTRGAENLAREVVALCGIL